MSPLRLPSLLACLTVVLLSGCTGSNTGSFGRSSRHHPYRTHHHRYTYIPGARTSSSNGGASRGKVPASILLGPRTKTTGCRGRGALQDSACTPGATFAGVTRTKICRSGYSHSVRVVPSSTKYRVYAEYGIRSHAREQYEIDHLVSLELGGSNSIANLWPEAASPTPGFHQKDEVENYLHDQVCAGRLSLQRAQREIATDWLAAYKGMH